jgi:peptide/nickel transport system permease protein
MAEAITTGTSTLREGEVRTEKEKLKYYTATQFQLTWWQFKKHRMALVGTAILSFFVVTALLAEFIAPTTRSARNIDYLNGPPQGLRFVDEEGTFHLRPFAYPITTQLDPETFDFVLVEDTSQRLPLRFFVKGEPYKFWGLVWADIHLFGIEGAGIHLLGTDELGRDLFSRTLFATRVSLSIGVIGMLVAFFLGLLMGGLAGYFGGAVDNVIQRLSEFVRSIPTIPIWMAVAAAMPKEWSPERIYFMITLLLGMLGWTTLARRVRGLLLSIRKEDFVTSAKISGCSSARIILRHMLPTFLSYIIVDLTISFPYMILGETSLSFIGLGLRAPVVSWGVLLKRAQQVKTISMYPWLLIPAVPVVLATLAFSLIGDGLRDAADPYAQTR